MSVGEEHKGVQITTWDKFRYAMDHWGVALVALAVVSTLFWKDLNEHAEFEKETVAQQGQIIQLETSMHEDHRRIIEVQGQTAMALLSVSNNQATTNQLLDKINKAQHGINK